MNGSSIEFKRAVQNCAALILICSMFLAGGCGAADETAERTNTASPSISASSTTPITPSPAVSETPFSVNPLFVFYHAYQSGGHIAGDALIEALSGENTADSLRLSLALSAHLVALSDIGATVCRLFPSDDGAGYSGTVEGAARGSGRLIGAENGTYTFTFTYDGGLLLIGEYTMDTAVRFSLGRYEEDDSTSAPSLSSPDWSSTPPPSEEPAFDAQRTCLMQKTAEGWTSTVEKGGSVSSFIVTDNAIEFTCDGLAARLESGRLVFTEALVAPVQ